MKHLSIAVALIALLVLPGCISRRDSGTPQTPPVAEVLDETNSHVVTDTQNKFSVRLPKDLTLITDVSESGARLLSVIKEGGDIQAKFMFIEETGNSTTAAADLLSSVDGVTVVRRDSITRNGFDGVKVTAVLKSTPGRQVPYYFLSAGGKTYVFSLPAGQPWQHFEAVIDSFAVVN